MRRRIGHIGRLQEGECTNGGGRGDFIWTWHQRHDHKKGQTTPGHHKIIRIVFLSPLLAFLLLFHKFDVLIDQNWPCRRRLIVCAQVFTFIAKIEKGSPLIQGDTTIRRLRFDKGTKSVQPFRWDSVLQDQLDQSYHHLFIQGTMRTLSIELKAELYQDERRESTENKKWASSPLLGYRNLRSNSPLPYFMIVRTHLVKIFEFCLI